MFPFFQYKAKASKHTPHYQIQSKHTPHYQIQRVNSPLRTNLKGVNFSISISKMHRLCVTGSNVYVIWQKLVLQYTTECIDHILVLPTKLSPMILLIKDFLFLFFFLVVKSYELTTCAHYL